MTIDEMLEQMYKQVNSLLEQCVSFDDGIVLLKVYHTRKYEEVCKQFDANIKAAMDSGNLKMVTCKGLK
jgi:hypothetical protein